MEKFTALQRRNAAIAISREITSKPNDYLVLDVESSGFNGTVMEVGVTDVFGNELFHKYRHPSEVCPPGAIAVHGLTPAVLDANGARPWGEWHQELAALCNGKNVIAYNAPFDCRILSNTAALEGTASVLAGATVTCAMQLWTAFKDRKSVV